MRLWQWNVRAPPGACHFLGFVIAPESIDIVSSRFCLLDPFANLISPKTLQPQCQTPHAVQVAVVHYEQLNKPGAPASEASRFGESAVPEMGKAPGLRGEVLARIGWCRAC